MSGMLIWLNGAFGAGKTSLAFELQHLHPAGRIFDPEEIGFGLRRAYKPSSQADFQDDPLWRELVCIAIERLAGQGRPLIVPMTLVNGLYFEEIVGELRARNLEVHHFALMASSQTLRQRLRQRGEWRHGFAAQNLERCQAALSHPRFALHINTDQVPLETLARTVLQHVGLSARAVAETSRQRQWRRLNAWRSSVRLEL